MWSATRVWDNKIFHPLLWPKQYLWGIVIVYSLLLSVLFILHKKEEKDKSRFFYYRALDIRKREMTSLKLSAVEPFIWKSLFNCNDLKSEVGASKGECIKVSFRFARKSVSNSKEGYTVLPEGRVLFKEKIAKPCTICHQKETGSFVHWDFNYNLPEPTVLFSSIWGSKDFWIFNAFLMVIFILFALAQRVYKFSSGSYLVAFSMTSKKVPPVDIFSSKEWSKVRRMFYYIEGGGYHVRGYIPKRLFNKMLKIFFTGEHPFSGSDVRAGAVLYKSESVSFEGLRAAQALISKVPEGALVVQEAALGKAPMQRSNKKAVLKRGEEKLDFRVFQINGPN